MSGLPSMPTAAHAESHTRARLGLAILTVMAIAAIAARMLLYRDIDGVLRFGIDGPGSDASGAAGMILGLRLSAVAAAFVVGAALGVSGVLLQSLLRNPLAAPFVLGLSSGAGLGVAIAIAASATGIAGTLGTSAGIFLKLGSGGSAVVGALAALAAVYAFGQRRGVIDPLAIILAGVVVSAICGALILFLHHLTPPDRRGELMTWMTGHIPQTTAIGVLIACGAVTTLGIMVAWWFAPAMDAAALSEEEARTIGVRVGRLRGVLYITSGVLAATAVTIAGPIGFVGLIAPHAARLLVGHRHRPLLLGAVLAGGALVVGADAAGQSLLFAGGRLPVGVFTALLGGPAFLWLLRRTPGGHAG